MDICNQLDATYQNSELSSIIAITLDVMELTITEDDFDRMTSDDIPSIARTSYDPWLS